MEAVQDRMRYLFSAPDLPFPPLDWGLVLEKFYRREEGISEALGEVFHFSLPPTVTTGFNGFYFDIREVFKVALGV